MLIILFDLQNLFSPSTLLGKFKCGIKNFSTSLTSMSPQELRELLQSSDHEEIYEGGNRSSIISQSDLEKMLDRTDLIDKLEESKKGKHQ